MIRTNPRPSYSAIPSRLHQYYGGSAEFDKGRFAVYEHRGREMTYLFTIHKSDATPQQLALRGLPWENAVNLHYKISE